MNTKYYIIDTALYNIAINFWYHIFGTGVVNLEMCDALIKIAIHLASNISEAKSSSTSSWMSLPIICEKAKKNLHSANQLLQHEDPDGPESGGLISGAKQLEITLLQFQ